MTQALRARVLWRYELQLLTNNYFGAADTGVGTSEKSKWLAQLAESSRVQPATSRCCTQLLVGQLARGNSDFTLLTQSRHTSGLTAGEARGLIFVHRALSKIISKFRETHFTKFKKS